MPVYKKKGTYFFGHTLVLLYHAFVLRLPERNFLYRIFELYMKDMKRSSVLHSSAAR